MIIDYIASVSLIYHALQSYQQPCMTNYIIICNPCNCTNQYNFYFNNSIFEVNVRNI